MQANLRTQFLWQKAINRCFHSEVLVCFNTLQLCSVVTNGLFSYQMQHNVTICGYLLAVTMMMAFLGQLYGCDGRRLEYPEEATRWG